MTDKKLAEENPLLNTISASKWQKIGTGKRAGVALPLFSLYSRDSVGVGDFADLKKFVDWCAKTGNSILQLLPLNEMGWVNCPYDALSSFAIEPLYISFSLLPAGQIKHVKQDIEKIRAEFPLPAKNLDYRIKQRKMELFWKIFSLSGTCDDKALIRFRHENSYWLEDFAFFKVLKATQGGRAWYDWDLDLASRDKKALEHAQRKNKQEIDFQVWLQYVAFKQLNDVLKHANSKGVFLKGDLPILVSRDSADVWANPGFFKLEFASGAPPDMYCSRGQRWGMPTYNWQNIAKDDYRYAREKFKYASNFYNILRVDHVVGLFRIWSIPYSDPEENKGSRGAFDPVDENVWGKQGRDILSVMLDSSDMLLCAEDLGVIPKVCTDTLRDMGIPGNDVARWVKDWSNRHDFLPAYEYRKTSVTMLSTHDTTNFAAWWKYEAGTIDDGLFACKCQDRRIDYELTKDKLFDAALSCHGRLRWKNSIDNIDTLVWILGKRKEEVGDFIEMYQNTYQEKEKLWKLLGMTGVMQEEASDELVEKALKFNYETSAIFSIQLITDLLSMGGIFKGDPYQYRINFPGTTNQTNWSLVLPLSLEELAKHKVTDKIKQAIADSNRLA
ncbi:MAG: 4-alpha-glucanotransferase [Candidatus Omnitrophica bacterium]|jgi:4-alpha-glucanotransferase|nr:4-alpha-glucanotransferase [Candidatus Omnitrophota bacterium]